MPAAGSKAPTKPIACEFSDEISGRHLVAFHWCIENDVPLDYNQQCVTVVDNTGAGPVFATGLQSDVCPDEDLSGTCLGKDGVGRVSVYGSGFSPGELDQICQPASFASIPGRPLPAPTGCTVTMSAPIERTTECRAVQHAPGDEAASLELRSPDNQFRFVMTGWSGDLAGSYSSKTAAPEWVVTGKVSYMNSSWKLRVHEPPFDAGDFELNVAVPLDTTAAGDVPFVGTLDATYAPADGHVEVITVHVDAE